MGLISAIEHLPAKAYHKTGKLINHGAAWINDYDPTKGSLRRELSKIRNPSYRPQDWPKGYVHPYGSSTHHQPHPPQHMSHNPHKTINFPGIFHAAVRRRH